MRLLKYETDVLDDVEQRPNQLMVFPTGFVTWRLVALLLLDNWIRFKHRQEETRHRQEAERISAGPSRIVAGPKRMLTVVLVPTKHFSSGIRQLHHYMSKFSCLMPDPLHAKCAYLLSCSTAAREDAYKSAAVVVVPPQLCIPDMLTQRLKPHWIDRIIAPFAEDMTPTCATVFCIREYKRRALRGLSSVVAMSVRPRRLLAGHFDLSALLRLLHVPTLSLWPRFRDSVMLSFQSRGSVDLCNLTEDVSDAVKRCETGISMCIEVCLALLRKAMVGRGDVLPLLTVERAQQERGRLLENGLRRTLGTDAFFGLSKKVRQAIEDIKELVCLLEMLFISDCRTFVHKFRNLKREQNESQWATWLFSKGDELIHTAAYERLKSNEPNGKWGLLFSVLREIDDVTGESMASTGARGVMSTFGRVLVVTADRHQRNQIQSLLSGGIARVLYESKMRFVLTAQRREERTTRWPPKGQRRASGITTSVTTSSTNTNSNRSSSTKQASTSTSSNYNSTTRRGLVEDTAADSDANGDDGRRKHSQKRKRSSAAANDDPWQAISGRRSVAVVAMGSVCLSLLQRFRPTFIVATSPNLTLTRMVESFHALTPGVDVRLYNLLHQGSVEVANYKASVEAETAVFHKLIRAKSKLAVEITSEQVVRDAARGLLVTTNDNDKVGECEEDMHDSKRDSAMADTSSGISTTVPQMALPDSARNQARQSSGARQRITDAPAQATLLSQAVGGSALADDEAEILNKEGKLIVVDNFEFKSGLPSMLHRDLFELRVAGLKVGDYVITPDVAVERKAVGDLIGSLMTGRLFTQANALCRAFKVPILLIEWRESERFLLDENYDGRRSNREKLSVLMRFFPKLRVVWSRSPEHTAHIFAAIKRQYIAVHGNNRGAADPDVRKLEEEAKDLSKANEPFDMLQRLPGVNRTNVGSIVERVNNLLELTRLSKAELTKILGPFNASALYDFLHSPPKAAVVRAPKKKGGSGARSGRTSSRPRWRT